MANVTNVILATAIEDKDKADRLNELVEFRGDIGLVSCLDHDGGPRRYGGDAEMQRNLHIGACGFLRLADLVAAMRATEWARPDLVQLLICGTHDEAFKEIDWTTGEYPEHYY